MLADLRISELLDTTAKLLDRAFRNPAAMAEEGAQLARERPASKDRVSADELTHRVSGFSSTNLRKSRLYWAVIPVPSAFQ